MIKKDKRCSVCIALRGKPRLAEEIYKTAPYLGQTDGEPLVRLWERHKGEFSYDSLRNHVKKHQFLDEADLNERHLREISRKAERGMITRVIESNDVFDSVITQGMNALQEGKLGVNTRDLLSAAKYKKDFQLRETGQQLAWMEMVFHFASGENSAAQTAKYDRELVERKPHDRGFIEGEATEGQTGFDPATVATGDSGERERRSRAFFQRVTGDAAPPGAD